VNEGIPFIGRHRRRIEPNPPRPDRSETHRFASFSGCAKHATDAEKTWRPCHNGPVSLCHVHRPKATLWIARNLREAANRFIIASHRPIGQVESCNGEQLFLVRRPEAGGSVVQERGL